MLHQQRSMRLEGAETTSQQRKMFPKITQEPDRTAAITQRSVNVQSLVEDGKDSLKLTIIPTNGFLKGNSCSNSDHDEDAAEKDTYCTGWNEHSPVGPWIDEVRGHAGGWLKRRSCKQFSSPIALHPLSLVTFALGYTAGIIPSPAGWRDKRLEKRSRTPCALFLVHAA